ncbi:hypothetical protein [Herpetosiphon geysericola]|uniref:PrcB C-terminal domain-containing protein n=1 Tax=Herpetosiphon geysericola TaxID=70996 RepID=A0A0P6YZV1_9CHLR|nr:hypothetical protein [Herpetosiphon geysericola]KPL90735.1 hypothetical protein SE18_05025 [Herpetosiphon geysericola]
MRKLCSILILLLMIGCGSQPPQTLPFTRLADLDDSQVGFDDYPYAEAVLNLRMTQTAGQQTRLLEELPKRKEPFIDRQAIQAVNTKTMLILTVFTLPYIERGRWVKINEVQRDQQTLTIKVEYHTPTPGQYLTGGATVMSISSIALDRALLPPADSLITIRVIDQHQTEWIRQVYELKPIIE